MPIEDTRHGVLPGLASERPAAEFLVVVVLAWGEGTVPDAGYKHTSWFPAGGSATLGNR